MSKPAITPLGADQTLGSALAYRDLDALPLAPEVRESARAAFLGHVERKLDLIHREQILDRAKRTSLAHTKRALLFHKRYDFAGAHKHAVRAIAADETNALAHYALALSYEGIGDLHRALVTYEKTLELDPSETKVYFQLGNIAHRLNMMEAAQKFYALHVKGSPQDPAGYVNLANIFRELDRFDEAVDVLRLAISRMPEEPSVWNVLGTISHEFQKVDEAKIFLEEALRIDPSFARAYYNIGYLLNHTGPWTESLDYHNKGLEYTEEHNPDRYEIINGRALCHFTLGNLKAGWQDWEVRHHLKFGGSLYYAVDAPKWEGQDIAGKKLLVVGEQGVGDELMFANTLPELLQAVGPDGQLLLACDRRLVPLYQRSFPGAHVDAHGLGQYRYKQVRLIPWATGDLKPDYYAPIGSTLRFYRETADRFPAKPVFEADPDQVARWRERLEALGPGPFVGICWRSMLMNVKRRKYYSPVEFWEPVFKVPGVRFINIQYGDISDDVALVKSKFGVDIHDFDDIDLRDDLDNNAALCKALDLVISAPTAAAAISGTIGTETWLSLINRVWPQFGTDHYPLYAKSRCFTPERHADWEDVMGKIAAALHEFASAKPGRRSAAADRA